MMEPVRGAKVVVYHDQWAYLLTRFGLVQARGNRGAAGHPAHPEPPGEG